MNRTLCLGLQFSKIKYVSEGKVSFSFGIALLSQFKPRKIVIPHSLPIVESLRIELIFFFFLLKERENQFEFKGQTSYLPCRRDCSVNNSSRKRKR